MAIIRMLMHAVVRLSPFSVFHGHISLSTVDLMNVRTLIDASSIEEYRFGVAPRCVTDFRGRDVSYVNLFEPNGRHSCLVEISTSLEQHGYAVDCGISIRAQPIYA
jgi:hypothetical protein